MPQPVRQTVVEVRREARCHGDHLLVGPERRERTLGHFTRGLRVLLGMAEPIDQALVEVREKGRYVAISS
jgi:hypothetical protein